MKVKPFFLLIFLIFSFEATIFAQNENNFEINFERNSISQQEDLVINLTFETTEGQNNNFEYKFPEIANFQKIGLARKREIIEKEEGEVYIYTFSQHYKPRSLGEFKIPILEFTFNGETKKSSPQTIIVQKGKDEFVENLSENIEEKIEEEGPILMVRTTNFQPFIGEGFTLKFALYIPEDYSQPLNFYRNDIQLPIQIQKIQINNCWQENYGIEDVRISKVKIGNKNYTEYCFFQSTFYPFDTKKIYIPSLKLSLVKSEENTGEEKNNSNSVEFQTKAIVITPRVLPDDLPNNRFPVGRYEISEKVDKIKVRSHQEVNLQVDLIGNGNTLNWEGDEIESNYYLSIQSKSKETSVFSTPKEMKGKYRINYSIIPQKGGIYHLRDFFKWVYFNTNTGKIDTLFSNQTIEVIGSAADSVLDTRTETSEIYQGLEKINSRELDLNNWSDWKKLGNLILILSVLILFILYLRFKN